MEVEGVNASNSAYPHGGGNATATSEDDSLAAISENIDHLFLMIMGTMIIFMQAGFAFLEAGSVRAKNTINILIKNFSDLCFGGLSFWLVGYAFAFGEGNPFIGFSGFASIGMSHSEFTSVFFQCTFAATCATIVSGAIAERCHFNGYIIFCTLMSSVIYPIPTHWFWSGEGWLAERGVRDFAGGGVIHLAGGVAAFVGAFILGPRAGRFKDGKVVPITAHSLPLVSLGGFILIMGFMAFNGGSQASISQPGDGEAVGRAIQATLVACGTGGSTVLLLYKFVVGGTWSLSQIINGCLAGMVSVCSGCNVLHPLTAGLLGIIAGSLYLVTSATMIKIQVDDPVDAVAVHAGSGFLSIILTPLFRFDGVIDSGGSPESLNELAWNAIATGVIIGYYAVTSTLLFLFIEKIGWYRVTPEDQDKGLDFIKHDDAAYHFESRLPTPLFPGEGRRNSLAIIINGAKVLTGGRINAFDVKPADKEQTQVVA